MASHVSELKEENASLTDGVIERITRFCMKTCILGTRKYHFHISSIRSPSKEKLDGLLIFC